MKILKVCFIGADGTGKTSIILRHTKNVFSNSYLPTIGCDFYEIAFSGELSFFLWDIASQKNFEKMRQYYLAYSHLALICVDSMRVSPEFIDPWIKDIQTYVGKNCRFFIVLNKIDLIESPEEIQSLKATLETRYKVPVLLTSAKTGENIGNLFQEIGKELVQIKKVKKEA